MRLRYSVSDTAEYGDYVSGPRIIDEHVRESMRSVLADIQSSNFAEKWIDENAAGRSEFLALRQRVAQYPIEKIGSDLRAMMPWLEAPGVR